METNIIEVIDEYCEKCGCPLGFGCCGNPQCDNCPERDRDETDNEKASNH